MGFVEEASQPGILQRTRFYIAAQVFLTARGKHCVAHDIDQHDFAAAGKIRNCSEVLLCHGVGLLVLGAVQPLDEGGSQALQVIHRTRILTGILNRLVEVGEILLDALLLEVVQGLMLDFTLHPKILDSLGQRSGVNRPIIEEVSCSQLAGIAHAVRRLNDLGFQHLAGLIQSVINGDAERNETGDQKQCDQLYPETLVVKP